MKTYNSKAFFLLFVVCAIFKSAGFSSPEISNLSASQRAGTKLVDITFDLEDDANSLLNVNVEVFSDRIITNYETIDYGWIIWVGYTNINATRFVGDGYGMTSSGTNKTIVWDAGADWSPPGYLSPYGPLWIENSFSQAWIRVSSDSMIRAPDTSDKMVLIPGGWFNMGDNYGLEADAMPVHPVYVSPFYIGKYEVTNEEMRRVMQWALDNGKVKTTGGANVYVANTKGIEQFLILLNGYQQHFGISNGKFVVQEGKENFPCEITWYDAQAYCNFRSMMEGLEPCINFDDWSCDFSKNGYRLPTEAEWEKAARGGLGGHHFPWPSYGGDASDHIDGSKANYEGSGDPYEAYGILLESVLNTGELWNESDVTGAILGTGKSGISPVGYYNGIQIPPGIDMANGYGLYDMAGNVYEWCYDWYSSSYYSVSPVVDPVGPTTGEVGGWIMFPSRVVRGGSFLSDVGWLRVSRRLYREADDASTVGFRIARSGTDRAATLKIATGKNTRLSGYGPITIDTTGPDTPGIIQFNTTSATADANAGSVTLSVMRLGGTLGTASVDYATSDGTALAGTDYSHTNGTLHWADGDSTQQTVSVTLLPSSGGDKTFSVLLSNTTGAQPGEGYTNAVVTIKSAESRTPVYRLYSYGQPDSTYEHVWTTDWNEMAIMSTAYGWLYEGVAWRAFSEYVQGTVPLYRLYAPSTRMHHYTIDGNEYYILTQHSGGAWNGEGIQYFVYPDSSVEGTMPVYRFYHAGMGLHHFTIDAGEAAVIQATPEWGYVYEDIGFYVYPAE